MVHKTFDMKYIAYFQSWGTVWLSEIQDSNMSQWWFFRKNIIYYSPFDFYKSSDKNSFFKTEFVSEDS